jgi:signal transduction histidine kinase/ligand-binding sensor domain-containing protein/DNA-binding response OmpR family regulator
MRNIIVVILCLINFQLFAKNQVVFSSVNASNGLSDNSVRNISQLNDGRMVIVTWGMINIFDGTNFLYLQYSDRHAYSLNNFYGWHRTYIDNDEKIWMKNQHKLYLFDVNKESFIAEIDSIFHIYGIQEKVTDFVIDSEGNTWYLTESNELLLKNHQEDKAGVFISDVSITEYPEDQLIDIEIAGDEVFLFYKSGVMVCYDITQKVELYRNNLFIDDLNLKAITIKVLPYNGYLYLVRNFDDVGKSIRFDTRTRNWDIIIETDCWQNTLTIDTEGNCWISTFQGLWLIDKNLENKQLISPIQLVDGSLLETEITTQYNDNSGGLWVGSINRGLLYYHPERFNFHNFGRTYFDVNNDEKLRVTGFAEINDDILVGTHKGLYMYNKKTGTLTPFEHTPQNTICNILYKDSRQGIWLGTHDNGLFYISASGIKHYNNSKSIQSVFERSDGSLFLGTDDGFGIFDPITGGFEKIKSSLERNLGYIYQLVEYEENKLLGISTSGLFIYHTVHGEITFPDREEVIFKHDNYIYHCIYKDSRGKMWFGTQDGLYVYNPEANSTQVFYKKDGLVNNAIRSIIEDNYGKIWVSTSNGISCIEITGDITDYCYLFTNYNCHDGVIENEFYFRSAFNSSDNHMFWGGIDGFNEIKLCLIDSSETKLSAPLITKFLLFGSEVNIGEKYDDNIILKQSISSIKKVELKHFQNFISFEFSALNYLNPAKTFFRYRLEGVDASWIETGNGTGVGRATYTNLPSGTYKLNVFAANNSKEWGDKYAELTIVIHPPIWKTTLAYVLYALILLSTGYLVLSFFKRLHKLKIQKKQNEALEQMKLAFFTNVSHELRTPLTLILTPLESILRRLNNGPLQAQIAGVYRNAQDLLSLVNQLLDYRKLEIKRETLQLSYCNVDEFIETIFISFKELASKHNINFTLGCVDKNIHGYIDKDKLGKIVKNLLSNAFKFTSRGGHVTLRVIKINNSPTASTVKIQVIDSGCGIPKDELSLIFNRFYQSGNQSSYPGSGIGLYLVKEYVQLFNGQVFVESIVNEGSTFTVEIPVKTPTSAEKPECIKKKEIQHHIKLLIVDDSHEFRSFLFNELSENYEVILASNGEEGLKKVREHFPDLVITDLVMPGMSGTELCRNIKNELKISHIPVILLTALASDEAKIEGFQSRADAFISKPFNMEILLLQMQNLIGQKGLRKDMFKKSIIAKPEEFTLTKIDQEFIKKAIRNIENNINNTSYSVEQLSRDMCMDRTGLYRKILALVEQTPTEFIRSIRLKKAAQLLEEGFSVNEVSEKVGFGTTSYFIKCFQKEFRIKPFGYKNINVR